MLKNPRCYRFWRQGCTKICTDCDVKIDIEEDGHVFISGLNSDKCNRALQIIESIVKKPQIGEIYTGRVTRITDFGAFVEFAPGKEGLCHISQLDSKRTEKVSDVVSIGDEILVKITEIDDKGRINLSRRAAISDVNHKKISQFLCLSWSSVDFWSSLGFLLLYSLFSLTSFHSFLHIIYVTILLI